MHHLYKRVAEQSKYSLRQFKTTTNPDASYKSLNTVSKIQPSLKEFITYYHKIGFTNIQNYLNL